MGHAGKGVPAAHPHPRPPVMMGCALVFRMWGEGGGINGGKESQRCRAERKGEFLLPKMAAPEEAESGVLGGMGHKMAVGGEKEGGGGGGGGEKKGKNETLEGERKKKTTKHT